jgi:hypothetical protein
MVEVNRTADRGEKEGEGQVDVWMLRGVVRVSDGRF